MFYSSKSQVKPEVAKQIVIVDQIAKPTISPMIEKYPPFIGIFDMLCAARERVFPVVSRVVEGNLPSYSEAVDEINNTIAKIATTSRVSLSSADMEKEKQQFLVGAQSFIDGILYLRYLGFSPLKASERHEAKSKLNATDPFVAFVDSYLKTSQLGAISGVGLALFFRGRHATLAYSFKWALSQSILFPATKSMFANAEEYVKSAISSKTIMDKKVNEIRAEYEELVLFSVLIVS
jgi:hypothetical protein